MSDNPVSAFINGVEHFATDIEELVGHAADALANLGINTFNGMEWFIQFLIQMQEDPVHVISRMAARIAEIGASVVSTLEEIVNGIRTHGLTGYLRIKAQDALTPFHNTMSQQISQSNQLTTLHQNTLTTMKQKLDTLKNNGTDANWRGPSVDAMSAAFTLHASTLTDLTGVFNNQNTITNKYALATDIDNFMLLLAICALVDLLIMLCGLVATPFTAGASVAVAGGLLQAAFTAELAAILAYLVLDTIAWQLGTHGLYFVTTQQTQTQPQTGSGTDGQDKEKKPKPVPPIPPGGSGPQNNLTPEQEKLADKLYNDYKGSGLSLDDIRAIIAANPNLSEKQLRELLDRYTDVINKNPNLVKEYGALAVFQQFVALAAYDPAHGGNYTIRKPCVERDLNKGIDEAMVELGAMEMGLIDGPMTPSTSTDYEATDSHGQNWDVKSPRSTNPAGKSIFNAAKEAGKMQKDFDNNEKIIIDDTNITPEQRKELYEQLKANGNDGKVIWWPFAP